MKKLLRHKGIWILAVALSLSLITAALSVFLGGRAGPLSDLAGQISRPIQLAATAIDQNVSHLYGQAQAYDALLVENQQLLEEVAALKEQARDGADAIRENALLRDLLDLRKTRRELGFESAKILSYSTTNWSAAITLNKGDAHGVAPNDCVVSSTGALIGIVSEVGSNWSTVFLTTDAGFELGGEVAGSGERGVLEGDFSLMTEGALKLSYLSRETAIAPGDEVLTFATEGIYPSGLLVGVVAEVRTDPSGMYSYAVITPATEPGKLSQVFVITEFIIED